jgi:hypothetical protein
VERAGSTRAMPQAVLCRSTRSSDRQSHPTKQRNPKPGVFEMTKIALTAAALLVATGAAFAGSDHYNPNEANRPAASVDTSFTAS